MADEFKPGDHVTWNTSQGTTEGTVERKLTGETHIKGFTAKPSADNPEYLVKSDKSGKEAAHKPGELRQASGGTNAGTKKTGAKKTTAKKASTKKTAAKRPTARKAARTTTAKRGSAR